MASDEAPKVEAATIAAKEPEKPIEAAASWPLEAVEETADEAKGPAPEEAPKEVPKQEAKESPEDTWEVVSKEDKKEEPFEATPVEAPKEQASKEATQESPKSTPDEESRREEDLKGVPPKEGAPKGEPDREEAPKEEAEKEDSKDAALAATATATAATEKTPIVQLWEAAKSNGHPEIWGVTLADPASHVPTRIVLQKYLNANDGDLAKAQDQMIKTLEWRAKAKPLDLVKKVFNRDKFGGLGYVTSYAGAGADPADPETKEVFTWNIYGAVKSVDEAFGDLNEFIEWRVALMELALAELSLPTATKPITADHDPYKIYQVHDYKSLSFLRQSPRVKTASTETIKLFAQNYPELLKEKFFVNVPAIMGFVYTFMKLFVAPKTIRKFHPMSNGASLAKEFRETKVKDLGDKLPVEYGGKGGDLKIVGKEPSLETVTE